VLNMKNIYSLVIFTVLLMNNYCFGQQFIGPDRARPQQLVTLELDSPLAEDPKFQIVPKSNAFRVLKDFDGKPVIVFVPSEDDAGKTFLIVYAANKGNKTVLATHSIVINPNPQPQPQPQPNPQPQPKNIYADRLKAAYLVSPDQLKLEKLIIIVTEVKDSDFASAKDASTVLKAIGQRHLPEWSDLRLLRDEIQKIIEEEYPTSSTFAPREFKKTLENVIGALKSLK
jgi:hypothetical protein